MNKEEITVLTSLKMDTKIGSWIRGCAAFLNGGTVMLIAGGTCYSSILWMKKPWIFQKCHQTHNSLLHKESAYTKLSQELKENLKSPYLEEHGHCKESPEEPFLIFHYPVRMCHFGDKWSRRKYNLDLKGLVTYSWTFIEADNWLYYPDNYPLCWIESSRD